MEKKRQPTRRFTYVFCGVTYTVDGFAYLCRERRGHDGLHRGRLASARPVVAALAACPVCLGARYVESAALGRKVRCSACVGRHIASPKDTLPF